jgi:hypothetical protein
MVVRWSEVFRSHGLKIRVSRAHFQLAKSQGIKDPGQATGVRSYFTKYRINNCPGWTVFILDRRYFRGDQAGGKTGGVWPTASHPEWVSVLEKNF